jgi:oxygen-dependent protoporphyrinogen oxidase
MWAASAAAGLIDASDEAITARTLAVIERIFPEVAGAIEFVHITRWREALPLTQIGGYTGMGAFAARGTTAQSPVHFVGDYVSGTGQNAAVAGGQRVARRLLRQAGATV